MAMYKIRPTRIDKRGVFRPTSKRPKWYATDDNRMVVDGVYMLPGRGNTMYRVEAKYGGGPIECPSCYQRRRRT